MSVLVVGSVVYDIIFSVHGDIKKEIPLKNGQLDHINLMFTAKEKQVYYGGTGGNIAYGIGMLGGDVLLHSVVGDDFLNDYKKHLVGNNVKLALKIVENKFTSIFYGISDEAYQQIGIFQPNVYYDYIDSTRLSDTIDPIDLEKIDWAIFSPGSGKSMLNHILELRGYLGNKVKIIFDPSQVLSILFKKEDVTECLKNSQIFIGNETEISQMESIFKISKKDIFEFGVEYIIETRGSEGVILHSKASSVNIPAHKPEKIVETTGAGDAFRAGLLFSLSKGMDILSACKNATITGAKCVEKSGGQLYTAKLN